MYDPRYEKDYSVSDSARDKVGIYGTGFDRASLMGFLFPFIIVGGIGIPLGLIIWKWL